MQTIFGCSTNNFQIFASSTNHRSDESVWRILSYFSSLRHMDRVVKLRCSLQMQLPGGLAWRSQGELYPSRPLCGVPSGSALV